MNKPSDKSDLETLFPQFQTNGLLMIPLIGSVDHRIAYLIVSDSNVSNTYLIACIPHNFVWNVNPS
jgi:hypothetical protein